VTYPAKCIPCQSGSAKLYRGVSGFDAPMRPWFRSVQPSRDMARANRLQQMRQLHYHRDLRCFSLAVRSVLHRLLSMTVSAPIVRSNLIARGG
jgi:hypothetical protein